MAKSIKPMWVVYGPGGLLANFDEPAHAEDLARLSAGNNVGSVYYVLSAAAAFVADLPVVRNVALQVSQMGDAAPQAEDIIDYLEAKAASLRGKTADESALREAPGKSPFADGTSSPMNTGLPPLVLREGAFYMRRDCGVVGPLRRNDTSAEWGWIAGGSLYLQCGRYSTLVDGHRYDLIAECDGNGWVEWRGGENPVPGAMVSIRVRRGSECKVALPANTYRWKHFGEGDDIVAFRVVQS